MIEFTQHRTIHMFRIILKCKCMYRELR